MSMFRVSSSELRQKAQQLEQMNAQFKTAIQALVTQEQSLATMFEGEAQKAFHTAFNNDRQQFENFYNGIAKYIQALRDAAQQYDQAEAKNLSIAQTRH